MDDRMPDSRWAAQSVPARFPGAWRSGEGEEQVARRPPGARGGPGVLALPGLLVALAGLVILGGAGCIQDGSAIPEAAIVGRVVPTGVVSTSVTTSPTSTVFTVNTTVPTVGVRVNMVGFGTNISETNPIGPLPGTSEFAFASTAGNYALFTQHLGRHHIVARGVAFDLAWGDVNPTEFNTTYTSLDLNSVTLRPNDPVRTDGVQHLVVKAPGRAVFIVFAEDFTINNVPVKSVRVLLDNDFFHPGGGTALLDDGAGFDPKNAALSGDLNAGDGIFTRVMTGVASGEHLYGFVINNDNQVRRDPYEEGSDFNAAGVRQSEITVK